MPSAPKTPTRTFRCSEDLWQKAKEKASDEGITLTDVLIDALIDFVRE